MRIAYFTHTYPTATNTFIQREVFGLREQGFDIRTFSVRKPGLEHDVAPEIINEKRNTFYVLSVHAGSVFIGNLVTFLTSPVRYIETLALAWRTARPGLRGLLYQCFYFQEAIVLAREIRRQRIDHLHTHLGDVGGTVALLTSRLANIRYSITFHGSDVFFDPTHWALREKVKCSSFVVCISHYCKSQIMLFSDKTDWNRLEIVRCGVDVNRYTVSQTRPKARKLLFTGRLAAEKGLPVLFESLSLLSNQGYEFELTLVGDGEEREALKALADRSGIASCVVFTGFASQDAIQEYLRHSDIFILPSFAEGIAVSLMEAMACGVPVIATYVGGTAELIENNKTGQIVFPGDAMSLKDAIARYLDDFELRAKVSKEGRLRVESDFNLSCEIERLANLFRSRSGRPPP